MENQGSSRHNIKKAGCIVTTENIEELLSKIAENFIKNNKPLNFKILAYYYTVIMNIHDDRFIKEMLSNWTGDLVEYEVKANFKNNRFYKDHLIDYFNKHTDDFEPISHFKDIIDKRDTWYIKINGLGKLNKKKAVFDGNEIPSIGSEDIEEHDVGSISILI